MEKKLIYFAPELELCRFGTACRDVGGCRFLHPQDTNPNHSAVMATTEFTAEEINGLVGCPFQDLVAALNQKRLTPMAPHNRHCTIIIIYAPYITVIVCTRLLCLLYNKLSQTTISIIIIFASSPNNNTTIPIAVSSISRNNSFYQPRGRSTRITHPHIRFSRT